ncbi:MAG: hypothetical protein WC781_02175 [Candidatus Pacearchaeota archaeon]|jgi:hypothetical protein
MTREVDENRYRNRNYVAIPDFDYKGAVERCGGDMASPGDVFASDFDFVEEEIQVVPNGISKSTERFLSRF